MKNDKIDLSNLEAPVGVMRALKDTIVSLTEQKKYLISLQENTLTLLKKKLG